MKRRTMIATTAIFALTAAMLFAGVVNAQQPTTATAQNTYGVTPQVLGHNTAAGNDASAYGYGYGHNWGGDGHNWGGDGHNWGGYGHNWGGYGHNWGGYGHNWGGYGGYQHWRR